MDTGPEEMRDREVRERLSRSRGEIDPDPSRADDEVEQLRLELAHTRAQMSETVYALQSRANPTYVREQATEQVKNSGLAQTVRDNPIPAALTGAGMIGLAWLIAGSRSQDAGTGSGQQSLPGASYGEPYRQEYPYGSPTGYDYGDSESGDSGSEQGRVGRSAEQARQRAGEMSGQARERMSQAGDQTREQAGRAQAQAQEQAQRAQSGFERALQENPLAVGIAAIGIGAAVGLAIPSTAKENELMGETRDQLANRAQRQVQEASQRAQRVAQEARNAAEEEASRQDLTE
jgi:ElaB/YqjD/DUF883 family membrane-anchored ribosome-binding protein